MAYVQAFLQSTNLKELFDDYEMFGRTLLKKDKNISLVLKRNNIDKAVYVGDTFWDCTAAEKAGIPFVFASYDFDKYEILLHILCKPSKWCSIKTSFWKLNLCQGTKTAC